MDTTMTAPSRGRDNDHDAAEVVAARPRADSVMPIKRHDIKPLEKAVPVSFGSAWYHEAAIAQAGRDAIEARCHPYR